MCLLKVNESDESGGCGRFEVAAPNPPSVTAVKATPLAIRKGKPPILAVMFDSRPSGQAIRRTAQPVPMRHTPDQTKHAS